MKKLILFTILFLGIFPALKQDRISLSCISNVYADDFGGEDVDSEDPCDPDSEFYDPVTCNGEDDSGNPCDPSSLAYDPDACASMGDQCNESSLNYDPSACEGATCTPGSPNYDEAECTAQDCDETSEGYDFALCEAGNCDPSSPNYDDTECEVSTCNPDSPNYDETQCAEQDCDEASAGYDPYLCDLGNCDPSSPNYDDTECEVTTCNPDSPNYDETQCAEQDCDETSGGYDPYLCDLGNCDPSSPNYDDTECEVTTCNPDSPNYDETQCAEQDCDETSAGYDFRLCELGNCDPTSPNYDDTECEISTCNPNSPNFDVDECDAQVCDATSIRYDPDECTIEHCDTDNINYDPDLCDDGDDDPCGIFSSSSASTQETATTDKSHTLLDNEFGWTQEENVTIEITACLRDSVWHGTLISVTGKYSEQVRLAPGVTEVPTPPSAPNPSITNSTMYYKQALDLKTTSILKGTWYMLSAIRAHENVHVATMDQGLRAVMGDIEGMANGLTVPNTGQSQDDATLELMSLSGYAAIIGESGSAIKAWISKNDIQLKADHGPTHQGPAYQAEHNITNPMIDLICYFIKHQSGWGTICLSR